jgi:hypothetical protein
MTKFIISFGANAMDHIPDEDFLDVSKAAHAVVKEIVNAGAYVLAGGLGDRKASIVATDGTISDGPEPTAISGITIVDVPTREEAFQWAHKIAVACRCPQEVWEVGHDPELENTLRNAGL